MDGVVLQMHLFDIDVPGGIKFKESTILSPGNDFLTFDIGKPMTSTSCRLSLFQTPKMNS